MFRTVCLIIAVALVAFGTVGCGSNETEDAIIQTLSSIDQRLSALENVNETNAEVTTTNQSSLLYKLLQQHGPAKRESSGNITGKGSGMVKGTLKFGPGGPDATAEGVIFDVSDAPEMKVGARTSQ